MKDRATTNATLLIEVIFKRTPPPHMAPDKTKLMTGFCQSIVGVSKDYGKWDLSFGQKNLTSIHYLSTISLENQTLGLLTLPSSA
jgi:hypothetical protein